jgi:hypothetical protein
MPDQPFVNLIDNQPPEWRSRVKGCIIHTANAVKIKAAPTVAQGPADALGRAVVNDPDFWAAKFAPVVASQLIGEPSLSVTDVADEELFSAVDAVWSKFFPQPTPSG